MKRWNPMQRWESRSYAPELSWYYLTEASSNTFQENKSVYGLERLRRSNPYTLLFS